MELFDYHARQATEASRPLAERMRPTQLADFMGQAHVVGPDGLVRRVLDRDRLFSMILWGPPGCGKTTLARIIAGATNARFEHFSAVLSGVKELRKVIAEAEDTRRLHRRQTVLFVDEIHRFNKAQQDAFLPHVESGLVILIGATTENPSFEVIPPLLSRCRVITLKALTEEDLTAILKRALEQLSAAQKKQLDVADEALTHLAQIADGDARSALNGLEIALSLAPTEDPQPDQKADQKTEKQTQITITLADLERALQKKMLRYDKAGEEHFNLISALHKSLRGSDPDAALYWLARMLQAGEDPLYVARRMVRFASEDVGNSDPRALGVALEAMQSYQFLGPPEGELALAQAAIYLATCPKSNRVYEAYKQVQRTIAQTGSLPVPLHIRNAPTGLMRELGYGKGYQYAHDHDQGYIAQDYLPEKLRNRRFYHPTEFGFEKTIRQRMDYWQNLKQQQTPPPKRREPK